MTRPAPAPPEPTTASCDERAADLPVRPARAARAARAVRAGQAAVLAAGALLAIVVLDRRRRRAARCSATLLRVGRRWSRSPRSAAGPLEEWLPIVAWFALRRAARPAPVPLARSATAALPATEHAARPRGALARRPERRTPRPRCAACGSLDAPLPRSADRGAARAPRPAADCGAGLPGGAFSLLDAEAQERRLARWGLVLSGAGGDADPADAVDRADRPGPGRRARALAPRRARSGGRRCAARR